jgi:hypothetical protein
MSDERTWKKRKFQYFPCTDKKTVEYIIEYTGLPESLSDNSGRMQAFVTEYCPGTPCSSSSLFVGITNSTYAILGYG